MPSVECSVFSWSEKPALERAGLRVTVRGPMNGFFLRRVSLKPVLRGTISANENLTSALAKPSL